MEIKTKFNIGDSVYFLEEYPKRVYKECERCVGEGSYEIEKSSQFINPCDKCDGSGKRVTYEKAFRISPIKIRSFCIYADIHNDISIVYTKEFDISQIKETNLFKLKKDAQKEGERRINAKRN